MNEDMNFEFVLKEEFKKQSPQLPESLKKENVIDMLEKEKAKPKKKKKHIFLKLISAAAALVIVVGSALTLPLLIPEKGLIEAETATTVPVTQKVEYKPIDNGLKATKLMQAESNDDLKNHFLRIYRENRLDEFVDGVFNYGFYARTENTADGAILEDGYVGNTVPAVTMATTAFEMESAEAPAAPGVTYASPETTQAGTPLTTQPVTQSVTIADTADDASTESVTQDNYGKTNTQVENVDEADIIKNDGKYLYILSGGYYQVERRVTIVSAADMKVVSRIILDSEDYYYNIQEMFVNGDRLVLLATESEKLDYDEDDNALYDMPYYGGYYYGESDIVSFVYDISDRENPSFVRKVSQDGSRYISSRMIDGVLYTVSSYWVSGDSEEEIKNNSIPAVDGKEVPCDCIYIYDYDSEQYIVLSAYDTKSDEGEVSSLSILGSGDEVYCSRDALYVAGTQYDFNNGNATEIYSFNLNGTDISYRASGAVKGTVLNQFSLDEYEENLRIATTYYSYKHDVDVSSVYVLNKDLQLIGQLEDIAYDEQVKSVRFMGDTGYIVTFRNTDPLFTLDLSDPTAPRTVGEVKLPGFSSYLHPVGDGLVAGIGYDGDDESADWSSIKVSLFDVSDLKNPEVVDTFVLKNVHSQALENPKAFIYYPEENLIGFPVEHYDNNVVLSYKLLKIENRVIESHLGYVHESERFTGDVFRGTYIGQKLYTISNYNVCEFDIATADMLRSCEILDVEEDMPEYYRDDGKYDYYYGYAVTTPAVPPGAVATTVIIDEAAPDEKWADDLTTITIVTDATTEATTVPVTYETTKGPSEFEAKVIEVNENTMLIEVTDGMNSHLQTGNQANVSVGDGSYKEGDKVRVVFDGLVQESYPLQLPNVHEITVIE
ncbi:MAG: hypothetical protein E7544_09835 [Ruminococcaceae bacterium]|nr:hypothetical protein [Oscillospiraceae bacterium]